MENRNITAPSRNSDGIHTEFTLETISALVNEFRKKGQFCDVKLKVENKEFPANKIMLAAFSSFFEKMFSGNFPEANHDCVTLTSVDADVMELILEYTYTTKIEVTKSNVEQILAAAHFFQAAPLIEVCVRFLEKNINAGNCLRVWALADVYSWTDLQTAAKRSSLREFSNVCKELEFLQLETDKLVNILSDDSLEASEETVLDAAIQWFHFKEEERETDLEKVFQQVRLAHIHPVYLLDRIEDDEALCRSESLRKLIDNVQKYHVLPHRRLTMQSSITRRRNNSSHVETMDLNLFDTSIKSAVRLHLAEDGRVFKDIAWPILTPLYFDIRNYKLACWSSDADSFWTYNFDREKWESAAVFLEHRNNVGLGSFMEMGEADGYWFAIGGKNLDGSASSNVERYDPSTNSWTAIISLPSAVWSPAVVSMSGKLYVLGGYISENTKTTKMQQYNILTNQWTELPPMPGKLATDFGVCALNNHIYVCCHSLSDEKVFFAFNVKTHGWRRCADMNNTFAGGPIVLNGRIFVISGNSNHDTVLECYNLSEDSWEIHRTLPGFKPLRIMGPCLMKRNREELDSDKAAGTYA